MFAAILCPKKGRISIELKVHGNILAETNKF